MNIICVHNETYKGYAIDYQLAKNGTNLCGAQKIGYWDYPLHGRMSIPSLGEEDSLVRMKKFIDAMEKLKA